MAKTSIEWTDFTFNTWHGCFEVSEGCTNCYAKTLATRWGNDNWGAEGRLRFFGEDYWSQPYRWDLKAKKAGKQARVFCASMADICDLRPATHPDYEAMEMARLWLQTIIRGTPNLIWLLLTKRPHLWERCFPDWVLPANVMVGTSAETQEWADKRIPALLQIDAPQGHFISYEPALGAVDFRAFPGIRWAICGGESGPGARPFCIDWARDTVQQCREMGVACFVKQMGARPYEYVASAFGGLPFEMRLADKKGGEMGEWPEDLRVREFPQ